jgi:hypothetical protein
VWQGNLFIFASVDAINVLSIGSCSGFLLSKTNNPQAAVLFEQTSAMLWNSNLPTCPASFHMGKKCGCLVSSSCNAKKD